MVILRSSVSAYDGTMRILIVEDDVRTSAYLEKGLRECGHVVDLAANGDDGLHLALSGDYDVIVLDRMLPNRDGLSLLKMLRADANETPVLLLSALAEVDDRVDGLRAGGDDYLVKPFAFSELLARIEAIARRPKVTTVTHELQVADLVLDLRKQTAARAGKRIVLQPREFRLLEFMMRHAHQVVTRGMLLEQVWEFHFDPQTNVIDVQISRLRRKIDRDFEVPLLHTLRGVGYKLSDTP